MSIALRFLVLLLLIRSGAAFGAPADPPKALGLLAPRAIGPAVTSGRVIAIAVHPEDRTVWYVGAASGGVWKTADNGTTFAPVFDRESSYSIGAVAIDPRRPEIVWVGTGELNAQRSVGWGDGVYKSEDGGRSWRNVGLKSSEHIGRIVVDPRRPDTVWVAAQGPLWGPGGDRGLYRTDDGGKTWRRMLATSEHTGVTDVVLDPRDPDTLYAATWQRRRHVFTYVGGGPESAIHRSTDGGATWTRLRGGLPGGDCGRIGLAVSPADPTFLYATVEAGGGAGGTFRSTDRGATWERRSDFTAQGMYYGQIICDPRDRERIYLMHVTTMVSTDGGKTVAPLGERNKHVDNHALWIDPEDPRHLIAGCDGGIYVSHTRGANWVFASNLPIAQFYRIAVDDAKPFYTVYGGTQDNNSLGGPSRGRGASGVGSADWFVVQGGDGFHQAVEPGNPDIVYTEYQDGGLARYHRSTGHRVSIQPVPGKGEEPYRFYWDSPLLISPHRPSRIWFAGNKVFRSDDRGDSWQVASPDLTRRIDRNRLPVMGAPQRLDTIARGQSTSFYGNVVSLDESPRREGLLWAGTDDGNLHVTEDGGKTWRKIAALPGVPDGTYVGRIAASRHAADTVYVLPENHKNADFKPYVLRSTDRGATWTAIQGDLPAGGPALSLAEDPVDPAILWVGTEFGLHVTVDSGATWHRVPGLPTIPVRDLKWQVGEDDLVVGTFGRGIWIVDEPGLLRGEAAWRDKPAALLPVRDGVRRISIDPRTGSEGETLWFAANPSDDAMFTAWVKDVPKSLRQRREEREAERRRKGEDPGFPTAAELRAEAAEEPASLIFAIADAGGTGVRRIVVPASSGLRRISWDLRHAPTFLAGGVSPGRGGRGGRGGGGGGVGMPALPGEYRVSMSLRTGGVETELAKPVAFQVVVEGEERLSDTEKGRLAAMRRRAQGSLRTLTGVLEMLDTATSRLGAIRTALEESPTGTQALRKEAADLGATLREIETALRGDDIAGQLVEPSPWTPVRRIQDAAYAVIAGPGFPTKTRLDSLSVADAELAQWSPRLRTLLAEAIPALERKMDAAGVMATPGRLPG